MTLYCIISQVVMKIGIWFQRARDDRRSVKTACPRVTGLVLLSVLSVLIIRNSVKVKRRPGQGRGSAMDADSVGPVC